MEETMRFIISAAKMANREIGEFEQKMAAKGESSSFQLDAMKAVRVKLEECLDWQTRGYPPVPATASNNAPKREISTQTVRKRMKNRETFTEPLETTDAEAQVFVNLTDSEECSMELCDSDDEGRNGAERNMNRSFENYEERAQKPYVVLPPQSRYSPERSPRSRQHQRHDEHRFYSTSSSHRTTPDGILIPFCPRERKIREHFNNVPNRNTCRYCGNRWHDSAKCHVITCICQRLEVLREKGICYKCGGHHRMVDENDCYKPVRCFVCGKKHIIRKTPIRVLKKWIVVLVYSISLYLIGLVFSTDAGLYWFEMFDDYSGFSSVCTAIVEVVVVVYVYGAANFSNDIRETLGEPRAMLSAWLGGTSPYFVWNWRLITPTIGLLGETVELKLGKFPNYRRTTKGKEQVFRICNGKNAKKCGYWEYVDTKQKNEYAAKTSRKNGNTLVLKQVSPDDEGVYISKQATISLVVELPMVGKK
ncbi:unnamed protein product [Caenorhabditis bovis]|uniref:Uncharacterized protein n=1 Tax=Caenorhabditis bovis TaxID=2654633 RepID=A0A8S1FCI8_9PELO|nr:unnamed protein product [Caenorhabditis bovis]